MGTKRTLTSTLCLFSLATTFTLAACSAKEEDPGADADTSGTDAGEELADVGVDPPEPSECWWTGDLDLDNAAQVADFVASGCDQVDGNVYFQNSAAEEIPTTPIRRVLGNVVIGCNPSLQSLSGLASLEMVLAVDRDPLVGHPTYDELSAGAEPLGDESFAGWLLIGGVPDTDVDGMLVPSCDNPLLGDLQGLEALVAVDFLHVIGNPGLRSLDGLDDLKVTLGLDVSWNGSLQSLDGAPLFGRSWFALNFYWNECLSTASIDAFLALLQANGGDTHGESFGWANNGTAECELPSETGG